MAKSKFMQADIKTKGLTLALKTISKDALPEAVAETLNVTADFTTKDQIKNVNNDFTIRTKFTLKSMESSRSKPYKALNKAGGKKIERMFSRVGTYSKYLWLQENSKTIKGEGGGAVPIATKTARTSKSEKKAIRKVYRLKRQDKLDNGAFGQSGYFRFFVGNPRGLVKGNQRSRGLYERSRNNKKLNMIRNLESDSVKITGTKFHTKAVKRKGKNSLIVQRYKRIAQKKLDKAVRKHG